MRPSVKRSLIAAIVAAVSLPAVAPSMANDRSLFYQGRAQSPQMPLVSAGGAVIDQALPRIIPAPYRVILDDSVPASLYLIWGNGDNWMTVLNRALAPIGLVAQADWNNNTISVSWRKPAAQAPVASPAPIVPAYAAPAASAAPAPAPAPAPVKPKGGFEVVQPSSVGNSGSGQPVDIAPTAKKVEQPARTATESPVSPVPQSGQTKFVFGITGQLPDPGVMWQLMKAVVSGDRLVLTGVSTVKDAEKRANYSNRYATRLRANLLAVGFPAASVAVVEHELHAERGNKPGVKILISRG